MDSRAPVKLTDFGLAADVLDGGVLYEPCGSIDFVSAHRLSSLLCSAQTTNVRDLKTGRRLHFLDRSWPEQQAVVHAGGPGGDRLPAPWLHRLGGPVEYRSASVHSALWVPAVPRHDEGRGHGPDQGRAAAFVLLLLACPWWSCWPRCWPCWLALLAVLALQPRITNQHSLQACSQLTVVFTIYSPDTYRGLLAVTIRPSQSSSRMRNGETSATRSSLSSPRCSSGTRLSGRPPRRCSGTGEQVDALTRLMMSCYS